MDIFLNAVFGALIVCLMILVGIYAFRAMSHKESDVEAEMQRLLLGRITKVGLLACSVSIVLSVTETERSEAIKTLTMMGIVGLVIFIVFSWDRIAARQIDEEKDE